MEFEGQRGDAVTPWSVGKYAKRSATIHLNSRDLVRPLDEHITSVIVGQDAAGLIFQDPKAVIRTALQAEPYSGEVRLVQSDAFTNPTFTIPALRPAAGADVRKIGQFGLDADDDFNDITQLSDRAETLYDHTITTGAGLGGHVSTFADAAITPNGYAVDGDGKLTSATAKNAVRDLDQFQAFGAKLPDPLDNGFPIRNPAKLFNSTKAMGVDEDDKFYVHLPLYAFPSSTVGGIESLRLDYTGSANSKAWDIEFLAQGNTGWVLELFYSSNRALQDGAKPGNYFYNGDSDWMPLYSGVATFVEFGDDNGAIYVRCSLDPNPNLTLLLSGGEDWSGMRTNFLDTTGGNDLGVLNFSETGMYTDATAANHQPKTATDAGYSQVREAGKTLAQHAKQIHWNLRKMPSITFTAKDVFPSGQSHCDYEVSIPSIIGYPEHKRCLIQVQSLSVYPQNEFDMGSAVTSGASVNQVCPVYVGVELLGVAGQNMFSTAGGVLRNAQFVGTCCLDVKGHRYMHIQGQGVDVGHRVLSYGYDNNRSILDDGVLCSSPFGRSIRVRFLNLTGNEILNTNQSGALGNSRLVGNDIINNPTHLTLRLLFLDDDDLPMR